MAKPIGPTPELEGKDAIEFLKKMYEPPSEKDKELVEKIKSQRIVLFWMSNDFKDWISKYKMFSLDFFSMLELIFSIILSSFFRLLNLLCSV